MREIAKLKLKQGYIVYIMSMLDCFEIFGGCGICDRCGDTSVMGYYVPVLNYYLCEECFLDWVKICRYYEDDIWFEEMHIQYVDEKIKENKEIQLVELFEKG